MKETEIKEIEAIVGYSFENKALLKQAFTRRSYTHEKGTGENNEILEFIGDRALDLAVASISTEVFGAINNDMEYQSLYNEGDFTNFKKLIVEKKNLAYAINKLGLHKYLIMGKGDTMNKVDEDMSVKEDLFEAIIGAIALDCKWNMEEICRVVDELLSVKVHANTKIATKEMMAEPYPTSLVDMGGKPCLIHFTLADEKIVTSTHYTEIVREWCEKKFGCPPCEEFWDKKSYMLNNLIDKHLVVIFDSDKEYKCELYIPEGKRAYFGYANTRKEAREEASKDAYNYLKENNLLLTINDEIGEVTFENAIDKLNELKQKGYINTPNFIRQIDSYDKNGNPIWSVYCEVRIRALGKIIIKEVKGASSAKMAKREVAHLLVLNIIEEILNNEIGG